MPLYSVSCLLARTTATVLTSGAPSGVSCDVDMLVDAVCRVIIIVCLMIWMLVKFQFIVLVGFRCSFSFRRFLRNRVRLLFFYTFLRMNLV